MTVKFFGTPLKEITSKDSGKIIFRFDTKGEFITDDPVFIERATGFFDHVVLKVEQIGSKVPKTFTETPMKITTKDEQDNTENTSESDKSGKLHCKKCDFSCDNQGELMRHYKTEHAKN